MLEADPEAQHLLSRAALTVFKLNGQFLEVPEHLARPAGLTAAWWQCSAQFWVIHCLSQGSLATWESSGRATKPRNHRAMAPTYDTMQA